jgi:hypothetical protein
MLVTSRDQIDPNDVVFEMLEKHLRRHGVVGDSVEREITIEVGPAEDTEQ